MSDTYASVQQDARHSLALNRAWIIARIEHNDPLATVSAKCLEVRKSGVATPGRTRATAQVNFARSRVNMM